MQLHKYVMGKDEEDSDAEDVFSPRYVEKTFKEGELMTTVRDEISRCFEAMGEAHEAMKVCQQVDFKVVL